MYPNTESWRTPETNVMCQLHFSEKNFLKKKAGIKN